AAGADHRDQGASPAGRAAAAPGEVTSADRLIDLLWGDDAPGNPPNALQAVVTRLRRALSPHGRDLLVTRTPGYALAVGHGQVDAARFEGLLAQASGLLQHDPATASDLLGQALGLWRGPALQDLADHDLIQHEIARLEELRLAALEARIQAELALGRHSEVLGELQPLAATHPLRERLQGQLMVALYRAGRQADALEVYQQTRTVLGEELGVDPEPALQALHQQILRQDPSLTAPVRSSRGRGQTLPARISSFIGRAAELDDLRRLLSRSRLGPVIRTARPSCRTWSGPRIRNSISRLYRRDWAGRSVSTRQGGVSDPSPCWRR
ncbi:MAG TPA: AfsR/SARP family transcriptional regulator, partial [Actinomycetes bacterium]|nr:AfsR/SARP family transcriptional regulator [Actinomycetes bacterium]